MSDSGWSLCATGGDVQQFGGKSTESGLGTGKNDELTAGEGNKQGKNRELESNVIFRLDLLPLETRLHRLRYVQCL